MGQPPGLFTELARWRDKAEKRGADCTFTSDIIPDWLHAEVESALDAVGVEAFGFLKAGEVILEQIERQMAGRIHAVFRSDLAPIIDAILNGDTPNFDAFTANLQSSILPILVQQMTQEALRVSVDAGILFDPAVINTDALRWARDYSYELVKGLTETTKKQVSEAVSAFVQTPGLTQGDIRKMIEPAFGPVRAEMIATTEVTRAYSQATNEVQRLVNRSGLQMERVWNTRVDEKVCPICGPLNDEGEDVWGSQFPDGPPAHPRCRCGLSLRIKETVDSNGG